MKELKKIFVGPAGRFALGVSLGSMATRFVDGRPLMEVIMLGLVLGVIALVFHSLISRR